MTMEKNVSLQRERDMEAVTATILSDRLLSVTNNQ